MGVAPWFEDFAVGDDFSDVPSVTITEGLAAVHQAIIGDRSRLFLDHEMARAVTGGALPVNPSLVCNLAIGQSTLPSQRVMGNLFYRGMVLKRPVYLGDTLTTTTRVVALRQNRARAGRAASGMAALEIHAVNQANETVMHFWRCPMIPCRDPAAITHRNDSFDMMPDEIAAEDLIAAVPGWQLDPLMGRDSLVRGESLTVEARDTVTLAPELVRLTINAAMAHTDTNQSPYGRRLVYGGHTIAIAAAQMSRVLSDMVTVLAWFKCDHTAPVFEQDILQSTLTLNDTIEAPTGVIGIVRIETHAERGPEAPEPGSGIRVLDWEVAVLLARRK